MTTVRVFHQSALLPSGRVRAKWTAVVDGAKFEMICAHMHGEDIWIGWDGDASSTWKVGTFSIGLALKKSSSFP